MKTSSFHLFLTPTPNLRSGCANMCHGSIFYRQITYEHRKWIFKARSIWHLKHSWNVCEAKVGEGKCVRGIFTFSACSTGKYFHWINFLLLFNGLAFFEATRRGGKLGHKNYSSSLPFQQSWLISQFPFFSLQQTRKIGPTMPCGGRRRTSGWHAHAPRSISVDSMPMHCSTSRRCTKFYVFR